MTSVTTLQKFCVMTNINGTLFYDKMILAEDWKTAETLCDHNEYVHGKYVTEIDL